MTSRHTFVLIAFSLLSLCRNLVSSTIYTKDGIPHVKLPNAGVISGTIKLSREGRPYHSFVGIPYAEIPERFQPSQPIIKLWTGVKRAVDQGNICTQKNKDLTGGTFGDEDCLNLNVYVPKNSTNETNFPVMVMIHGGGMCFGNGFQYGARYFMDENVIFVTLNYRLGVFGFLSTGDNIIPGNNGLKDQVLALKWVQENIKSFGGDSSTVTILGESAGGASVHFHLLSPMSKGLFHRAISQSGSALGFWSYQRNPRNNAVQLATHLKCTTSASNWSLITSIEIRDCLKNATARELNEAQFSFKQTYPLNLRPFIFTAVTERVPLSSAKVISPSFLTEVPMKLLSQGKYETEVPFMIGAAEDEGCPMYAEVVLCNESLTKEMNSKWDHIAPKAGGYDDTNYYSLEKQKVVSDQIRQLYFGNKTIGRETVDNLTNFFTDQILYPVYKAAVEYASKVQRQPVFLYQYAYSGPVSIMGLSYKIPPNLTHKVGHVDEIQHLYDFDVLGGATLLKHRSQDETFSRNLVRLWASFAIHGEPKYVWGANSRKKWDAVSNDQSKAVNRLRYYRLDENPTHIDDLYKHRLIVFDKIFEQLHNY